MEEALVWDVLLPPAKRSSFGHAHTQASVLIQSGEDDGGPEAISVPLPVARHLLRLRREGEANVTTVADLRNLIVRITPSVARQRAIRFLERRDYPRGELQEKLVQDGFERHIACDAVTDLEAANLLSDTKFAQSFVSSKIAAGWGLTRIERELSRRGVEVSKLAGWPHDYIDPEEEFSRALEVASKKTVREPNAQAKMARFLVGRGFSYDVARRVASKIVHSRTNA